MFEQLDDPHAPSVPPDAFAAAVRRGSTMRSRRRAAVVTGVATGAVLAFVVAAVPSLRGAGHPAPGAAAASPSTFGSASAAASPPTELPTLDTATLLAQCDPATAKAAAITAPAGFTVTAQHRISLRSSWSYVSGDTVLTVGVECAAVAAPLQRLTPDQLANLRPDADSSVSVSMTPHEAMAARVVTSHLGDDVVLDVQPSPFVTVTLTYHQHAGAPLLTVGQLWELVDGMHLTPA